MRKILMMAVLAFLSLQGVGARASGISLLEHRKIRSRKTLLRK